MVYPDRERWHAKVEGASPPGAARTSAFGVAVNGSTRRSGARPWRYAGLLPDGAVPDRLHNGERGAGAHRRHRWLAERRPPSRRWATARAPRGTRNRPIRRCRRGIVCSETATRGCAGRTRGSDINISRPTWTSSQSASSSIELRGPPFTPCSASGASRYLRPTTRCMGGVNRIGINHIWYSSVI